MSTRSPKHHDLIVTNVFHAGDGNLHPLLSFDRSIPGTLERVLEASDQIVRLCVDAGGALSGEHGIGLEKRDFMPLVFTAEDLAAQACVRDAFDPDHRMNPQKVLPAGARCGDFAMMRGSDAAEAAAQPAGGFVDLIHPHAKQDVEDAVRDAAAARSRLLVIGGRTHMDRGNPTDVDAELWTTMLDEVVAYEPAEMLAVVHAGMRVGDLQAVLAEGGQEWPVDAHPDATVGGVIAAGVSSFRRLRLGHVRDTVVELELVRGDGRLVKSGARTVKNVTGYDLHRLATGSLGTLGVIVQVALKLRPLPQVRRTLTLEGDGLALGRRLLETVPLPSAVIAEPGRARVWLEGWADEVEEQTTRRANDRPRACRRPPAGAVRPDGDRGRNRRGSRGDTLADRVTGRRPQRLDGAPGGADWCGSDSPTGRSRSTSSGCASPRPRAWRRSSAASAASATGPSPRRRSIAD